MISDGGGGGGGGIWRLLLKQNLPVRHAMIVKIKAATIIIGNMIAKTMIAHPILPLL
jgi:hypothetical protein